VVEERETVAKRKTVKKAKKSRGPKFPNRLRELREGGVVLTQAEMGQLAGYDYTTVCRHESGERPLTREALDRYAEVLKVMTIELIVRPPDEPEE
jgi:hypothetical protein